MRPCTKASFGVTEQTAFKAGIAKIAMVGRCSLTPGTLWCLQCTACLVSVTFRGFLLS